MILEGLEANLGTLEMAGGGGSRFIEALFLRLQRKLHMKSLPRFSLVNLRSIPFGKPIWLAAGAHNQLHYVPFYMALL